MPDSDLSQGT